MHSTGIVALSKKENESHWDKEKDKRGVDLFVVWITGNNRMRA